ncbi:MAG: CDP-alcohol phosphatidyltransferase family protein [Nanoarchaeota archaeon]|nr:CDP-alcohol phosphatidyltransferase family protein [Nanoarchaeota archaeon]
MEKKAGRIKSKIKDTQKELKEEAFLNIPNSITLLRLVLIFVFIYMLFNNFSALPLTIIFGFAAITDWFDGFFARKLQQTTKIGARMDQVIDRVFTILIVMALVMFAVINQTSHGIILSLFLISSREIIGLPGFLIVLIRGKDPYKVRYIGKVTTFIQSIALGLIILGVSWAIYPVVITCIFGIVAGFDYLRYSLS